MPIQPISYGASLPLWVPDEGILAENINPRERKYGGIYTSDFIGVTQNSPIITIAIGGELYDEFAYGFGIYAAVLGNSLMQDPIAFGENAPIFNEYLDGMIYDDGDLYGYIGYATTSYLEDPILFGELTPTFVESNTGNLYDDGGTYGLIQYSSTINDEIEFGEDSPSLITNIISTNVYGTGKKYGFCVWQA